jgi:molybdopterin converting factor small subunit
VPFRTDFFYSVYSAQAGGYTTNGIFSHGIDNCSMSVKVNVYYFLPHLFEARDDVEVEGDTVGACLEQLIDRYPKARRWLFGEDGRVANFADLYLNYKIIDPEDLTLPVGDGDVIHIVMMLTAG